MNFEEHSTQWILLIVALLGMAYAAFVIKREKDSAFVHGHDYEFHGVKFRVPTWWAEKESESGLSFHRADTYYDWRSNFTWHATPKDFNQFTIDWFAEKKIIIDEDGSMEENLQHVFKDSDFQKSIIRARRIEGMGTQDVEKRIYLDVVFIQMQKGLMVAQSHSSVLNGCLEGPYFEEVVYNFSSAEC